MVRFESRDAARANSERPEQGAFAERMGALMDGDVQFFDYDEVLTFLDGGSDDAGFVQLIQGRTDEPRAVAHALRSPTDDAPRRRPDLIGGTVAHRGRTGPYTETVAFTDEAKRPRGRAGRHVESPPELSEAMQRLLQGAEFYDLREVWFESP